MKQITTIYPDVKSGSAEKQTSLNCKLKPMQQRVSATELAAQLGMDFPSNGLPVLMDDQEGPVAVHAEDLVSTGSNFLTDSSGHIVTVQPMMGG